MTIRPSNAKLPAAGLALGMLLLAAASDSYAGPQVAGAGVTPCVTKDGVRDHRSR